MPASLEWMLTMISISLCGGITSFSVTVTLTQQVLVFDGLVVSETVRSVNNILPQARSKIHLWASKNLTPEWLQLLFVQQ